MQTKLLFAMLAVMVSQLAFANGAPDGAPDYFWIQNGADVTYSAANGVLANDTDPDGQGIILQLQTSTINGSLSMNGDGSFNYTHDGSATTSDFFTYRPYDGQAYGNITTALIFVEPANTPNTTRIAVRTEPNLTHTFIPTTSDQGTWSVNAEGGAPYDLSVDGQTATFTSLAYGAWTLVFTTPDQITDHLRIESPAPPPCADPFADDVVMLLDFEESDGSTVFTDRSPVSQVVEGHGNPVVSHQQAQSGDGALYLDGSSWLQIEVTDPVNQSLIFGTDDVTIDFWVWSEAPLSREDFFCFDADYWDDYSGIYYYPYSQVLGLYDNHGRSGSWIKNNYINGRWAHLAYVRDNTTGNTTMYLDGIAQSSEPHRGVLAGRSDFYIGIWNAEMTNNPNTGAHGYIDNFRVTRALRWTENFDPACDAAN